MKKKSQSQHNTKQHSKPSSNKGSESAFNNFTKHFFNSFTEKDKEDAKIYMDMQCMDASKLPKQM